MKPNEIVTERLHLCALRPEDKADLIALLTDEKVGKTYMVPDLSDEAGKTAVFERLAALSALPGRFFYGVYRDDRLIGILHEVERKGGAVEIGYALRSGYWGSGYMTEAVRAAIPVLFRMGFDPVKAAAFAENAASLRVMEKCGMRRTGETETVSYRGKDRLCICCEIREKALQYRQEPKGEKDYAAN